MQNDSILSGNYLPRERSAQDLSRTTEKTFVNVPPFTLNPNALGDDDRFLNKSSTFILVPGEDKDIQADIQSYASDCDIYNILRRASAGLDVSTSFTGQGVYGDFSSIPTNPLDVEQQQRELKHSLDAVPADVKEAVLSDMTADEVLALLRSKVSSSVNDDGTPQEDK